MACTLPLLTYLELPAKARTLALALTGRNKMFSSSKARNLVERLEEYRAMDGGYNQNIKNSKHGTVYAAYLAFRAVRVKPYTINWIEFEMEV
jgi:hypothetical protein